MNTRNLKKQLRYKIPQLKLALIREPANAPLPQINTPSDLEQYFAPMTCLPEEHFVALHLNPRHQVIGYHVVSHGTLSSSLVHPREVFKAALLSNAHAIVVAHNHPSGLANPSLDDIATTDVLVKAGKLMNVEVLDHLIITEDCQHSIRESNPELF